MKKVGPADQNDHVGYNAMLGKRYAMLPLDEEHFKIDANSRIITVPEAFRKNGIAVQGDETAEVIYFKIDRYFDFMDLNNAYIIIQWHIDGTNPAQNNAPVSADGSSLEWVRDIESEPNKLIFGWALDSEITKYPGTLKFSVRFIGLNEKQEDENYGKIEYSLSTLEATAIINKALDLKVDITSLNTLKNKAEAINNRINSRTKTLQMISKPKATKPIYTLTIADWVKQQQNSDKYIYSVDLKDGEYIFKIQAFPDDGGDIIYSWYKDGKEITDNAAIELIYEPVRVIAGDEMTDEERYFTPLEYHLYFTLEEKEGKKDYKIIDPDDLKDKTTGKIDLANTGMLYESFGAFTANIAGKYFGVATNANNFTTNSLPNPNDMKKNETEPGMYGPIEIPFPENTEYEVMSGSGLDYMLKGGSYSVTLNPNPKNETATSFKYLWYKDYKENKTNTAISEKTDDWKFTVVGDSEYTNVQGAYRLETIATRNNADNSSFTEDFIVTYPPSNFETIQIVKVNTDGSEGEIVVEDDKVRAGDRIKAIYQLAQNYQLKQYEDFQFQWQFESEDEDSDGNYIWKDILGANASTFEVALEIYTPDNTEDTTDIFKSNIRCRVTNNYNNHPLVGYSTIAEVARKQ